MMRDGGDLFDHRLGYRAIHVKGRLDDGGRQIGCEVQVRTGCQDAFAIWSRSHLYRSESLPDVLVRLGKAQADHLAAIDDAFETIREIVLDYQVSPVAKSIEPADQPPEVLT